MSDAPDIERLEAQHGPTIELDHPDGSRFVFKVVTREAFDIREARAKRGEVDADERLLQMLCVWPSVEAWNAYVEASAFETMRYVMLYREAFGGGETRLADRDELPEHPDPSLTYFKNGEALLAFRKPGRAEVKLFAAETAAVQRGESTANPTEKLLRGCATPETRAWLDANPFGVGSASNAFVTAFGFANVTRVTGKR